MPTVLFCDLIHLRIGVLLDEPSFDGSPNIVIDTREDALRAPRMSIEVPPATQDGVQTLQAVLQGLSEGGLAS